jgi:cell division protein FtsB
VSFFRVFAFTVISGVFVAAIYSSHGFLDLRRLRGQITATKERVGAIELENQRLKRQVNLFEKPTEDLAERELRDFLGWVKPNELVYLEKIDR